MKVKTKGFPPNARFKILLRSGAIVVGRTGPEGQCDMEIDEAVHKEIKSLDVMEAEITQIVPPADRLSVHLVDDELRGVREMAPLYTMGRPRFRKRPVVVGAEQFFPDRKPWPEGVEEAKTQGHPKNAGSDYWRVGDPIVRTANGVCLMKPGDWVIKGVDGEFYPCPADVFDKTHERVHDVPTEPITAMGEKHTAAGVDKGFGHLKNLDPKDQESLDGSPAGIGERYINVKFQCGPIQEHGVNGTTIERVIELLVARLEGFQKGPFACDQNAQAIVALEQGKLALEIRTGERKARGVEGTNEP